MSSHAGLHSDAPPLLLPSAADVLEPPLPSLLDSPSAAVDSPLSLAVALVLAVVDALVDAVVDAPVDPPLSDPSVFVVLAVVIDPPPVSCPPSSSPPHARRKRIAAKPACLMPATLPGHGSVRQRADVRGADVRDG
jgi:hypothetical protein